ncbi:type II toxin-antitoxin system VapC family toxin [Bauldia sp.]|uniref:type II toxin-antitoxin system VapC family toxin n=1 Tax=Bauldia sp. TaxID=2575872 RepID=UPI003BAB5616
MTDRGYLLDTNVVSESTHARPDARVSAFLDRVPREMAFLSVLTIGELRKGVEIRRRHDQVHAERLSAWVDGLEEIYADALLPVDSTIASLWGRLAANRPRPVVDTLLAATAINRGLTLVTRNVRDIADTGVVWIDPWQDESSP